MVLLRPEFVYFPFSQYAYMPCISVKKWINVKNYIKIDTETSMPEFNPQ